MPDPQPHIDPDSVVRARTEPGNVQMRLWVALLGLAIVPALAGVLITGVLLAASFASAAYGFGRMTEPERTDLISLAIFGAIGLVSQAGLLLAPWAVSRGPTPRIIAALLMGPSGVFLSIFAYEGLTRYAAGAPVDLQPHAHAPDLHYVPVVEAGPEEVHSAASSRVWRPSLAAMKSRMRG